MVIGIDIGTSGVKVVLLDVQGQVAAVETASTNGFPPASVMERARSRKLVAGHG